MPRFAYLSLLPLLAAVAGCHHDSSNNAPPDLGGGDTGDTADMGGDDLGGGDTPDMALPPPPSGIKLLDTSNAAKVTPDGRYVLLQEFFASAGGEIYIYDSYLDQTTKRGDAINPDPAMGAANASPLPPQGAFSMSADTSRIIGSQGAPLQAAYLAADGWHHLGTIATGVLCVNDPTNMDDLGSASAGWDISDDGKTIVGMNWNDCTGATAIRWTEGTGGQGTWTELEFAGLSFNRATKVSADGKIVGGWINTMNADRSPAIWDAAGHVTVFDPTGMVIGEVLAMTPDGKVVTGPWNDANGNSGFYWNATDGVKILSKLPTAQDIDQIIPNVVAAGGDLIFGTAGDLTGNGLGSPLTAFVWTKKDNTMRPLQDIVTASGFTLPANITLSNVLSATADGSVIVGATLDNDPALAFPKQGSFVLRLPVSAYGL